MEEQNDKDFYHNDYKDEVHQQTLETIHVEVIA
jgi:hypothetical protein